MTSFVYILQLQHGKFYVGITNDLMVRLGQHMTSRGACWTQRFPFLKLQHAESFHGKTRDEMEELENEFTLMVMSKRGIIHTRGGKWAGVTLSPLQGEELTALVKAQPGLCAMCGTPAHGECLYSLHGCTFRKPAATKAEATALKQAETQACLPATTKLPRVPVKKSLPGEACVKKESCCSRCGRPGHNKSKCFAYTDKDGKDISCKRCGRSSHKTAECNATSHRDGHALET